jgi:toxin YxiD
MKIKEMIRKIGGLVVKAVGRTAGCVVGNAKTLFSGFSGIDPFEITVPKRLGGYKTWDVDLHGNLSPGTNRAPGYQDIATDGYVQSHHLIQNEWGKRWAKKVGLPYDENKASAMLLKSDSGSPHAKISAAQRERRRVKGFDTDIQSEFNISYREMLDAGVEIKIGRKAIHDAYKYFESLGGFVK